MTALLQQLGIDRMTVAERIALAQEIPRHGRRRPGAAAAVRSEAELDRRVADCVANPSDGVPWAEVEAAALRRFGR